MLVFTAGGDTVSFSWARYFIHWLVLVQPRKTSPNMTENLLTGEDPDKKPHKAAFHQALWSAVAQLVVLDWGLKGV